MSEEPHKDVDLRYLLARARTQRNDYRAEVLALRAELADVRAQWQADVGSAIARAMTAEARAANAEALYRDEMALRERYGAELVMVCKDRDAARAELDRRTEAQMQIQMALSVTATQRDAARAEAARLRTLLAEQADVITAKMWNIPPEYAARNILLDVAVKMREAAALRGEPAPAGGQE